MKIFQRVTELAKANINHLLDQAEDPEVMVKQLIRDMETSIIELRRETVRAVSREKQLQKQIAMADGLSSDYSAKAKLAVDEGNEELARKIIAKKIDNDAHKTNLEAELKEASVMSEQLKIDLVKLEDKVQGARRKKEELIRRKRSADAKMRINESAQKATDAIKSAAGKISGINEAHSSLQAYEDAIMNLEAEAEAAQEIANLNNKDNIDLEKMSRDKAIEEELKKLQEKKQ